MTQSKRLIHKMQTLNRFLLLTNNNKHRVHFWPAFTVAKFNGL